MFTIKVADFTVEIHNRYRYVKQQCAAYRVADAQPDFAVAASPEEIAREGGTAALAESICLYRRLGLQLPEREALLMHGAVIAVQGRGVMFTAPSGTGKTTHMLFWKRRYGEAVTVINGDKPIVRFARGKPVAFGTPWAGKERLQSNGSVGLTDICFIERSEKNEVERVEPAQYLERLMPQVLRHTTPQGVMATLALVDRLTETCRFWVVRCNMSEQAAEVAYEAIVRE